MFEIWLRREAEPIWSAGVPLWVTNVEHKEVGILFWTGTTHNVRTDLPKRIVCLERLKFTSAPSMREMPSKGNELLCGIPQTIYEPIKKAGVVNNWMIRLFPASACKHQGFKCNTCPTTDNKTGQHQLLLFPASSYLQACTKTRDSSATLAPELTISRSFPDSQLHKLEFLAKGLLPRDVK